MELTRDVSKRRFFLGTGVLGAFLHALALYLLLWGGSSFAFVVSFAACFAFDILVFLGYIVLGGPCE